MVQLRFPLSSPESFHGFTHDLHHAPNLRPRMVSVCSVCRALYFLEPMLIEQGLGTSPGKREHLASDDPNASADLAHLNSGSGCGPVPLADAYSNGLPSGSPFSLRCGAVGGGL